MSCFPEELDLLPEQILTLDFLHRQPLSQSKQAGGCVTTHNYMDKEHMSTHVRTRNALAYPVLFRGLLGLWCKEQLVTIQFSMTQQKD